MRSQGFEIAWIGREGCTAWFGQGDNEGVDGRASPSEPAQVGRTSCKNLGYLLDEVARLQESICDGVACRVALQAFDQHDGRNAGRPEPLAAEGENEGC